MVKIAELAARKVKEVLKAQNKEKALLRLYLQRPIMAEAAAVAAGVTNISSKNNE